MCLMNISAFRFDLGWFLKGSYACMLDLWHETPADLRTVPEYFLSFLETIL